MMCKPPGRIIKEGEKKNAAACCRVQSSARVEDGFGLQSRVATCLRRPASASKSCDGAPSGQLFSPRDQNGPGGNSLVLSLHNSKLWVHAKKKKVCSRTASRGSQLRGVAETAALCNVKQVCGASTRMRWRRPSIKRSAKLPIARTRCHSAAREREPRTAVAVTKKRLNAWDFGLKMK